MEKNSFIADFKPGDMFEQLIVRTSQVVYKEAKNGHMCTMMVRDRTTAKASKFGLLPREKSLIDAHQHLILAGTVQDMTPWVGEIRIDKIQPFLGEVQKAWFLAESNDRDVSAFRNIQESIHEQNLRQLLRLVFTDDVFDEFSRAVAAKSRHHDYHGGLLEHSVEVAKLCEGVTRRAKWLQCELIICAALLHDIGKLDEMDHTEDIGQYTLAGNLRGHVDLGRQRVEAAMDTIPDFPIALRNAIVHMILSHHGRPEYGAATKPGFAEAYVLAQCDLLSARLFACRKAAGKAIVGSDFVELAWREEDDIAHHLYVGDFGLKEPVPAAAQEPKMMFATRPAPESVSFRTVLPILGSVAAGVPGQGAQYEEEREVVLPPEGADYIVRVIGDSMIDVGIHEGDLLYVKQCVTADNGKVVVASTQADGYVVKTLRTEISKTGDVRMSLVSHNSAKNYAPILCTEETRIQGRVVGLMRDFES